VKHRSGRPGLQPPSSDKGIDLLIIERLADALLPIDPQGRIQVFNSQAEHLTGFARERFWQVPF
jgi:PAS domain-containing protein